MATANPFQGTFDTLRRLLKPYERQFAAVVDAPGKYYLATKTSKTSSGAAVWFGGVEIKKNYVTFHLVPVYAAPALVKTLSPSLRKRMHGKGCFNFTDIEPAQLTELKALTKRGFDGFVKKFS